MPFSHRTVVGNSSFSPRMNLFVCLTSILWAITTSVLWQPRNGIWMDLNWNQPKFGRVYYRLTEISCSTNSGSSVVCCKSGMTGPMHSLHPSSFVKVSQVSHLSNCWNKPKSYSYTISIHFSLVIPLISHFTIRWISDFWWFVVGGKSPPRDKLRPESWQHMLEWPWLACFEAAGQFRFFLKRILYL